MAPLLHKIQNISCPVMGSHYICCLSTSCMHRLLHIKDRQVHNAGMSSIWVISFSVLLVHHSSNMVPFIWHSLHLPCTRSYWVFPLTHMPGILLRLYRAKRMQAWIISLLITRFQRLALLHDSNLLLCGWARTCFTEESAWQNPLCWFQWHEDLTSFVEMEIP